MTFEYINEEILKTFESFGGDPKNKSNEASKSKYNSVSRYIGSNGDSESGSLPWLGILREGEPTSGRYYDFSYVIFPDKTNDVKRCIVCLIVGTDKFKNDYEAAVQPYWRREFLTLGDTDNKTFFKNAFDDIESNSTDLFKEAGTVFNKVKDSYQKEIVAAEIVEFGDTFESEKKGLERLQTWLALYSKLRQFPNNDTERKSIQRYLPKTEKSIDSLKEISKLLDTHKYVILQGAPGTGKTYSSTKISKEYNKTFFTQFHAETTYSDFVWGLIPQRDATFKGKNGILLESIDYALAHPKERVLLIVDEINRANLANVLGPVFYLFEKKEPTASSLKLTIGNKEYERIPANLYVLCTMNTADRSLAVVDFALRRRFIWYNLKPQSLEKVNLGGQKFFDDWFNEMNQIFRRYATDMELSLQPGQSYFIAKDENEMKERLKFELMPLIKEYLIEGYLPDAKNAFSNYFRSRIGANIFE